MDNTQNQNNEAVEKATGIWSVSGEEVKFTRVWGGHRFTDEEVAALLAGQEIQLTGLKDKNGDEYGVQGKLDNQTYNGHDFIGFKNLKFLPRVPNSWCGYKFSAAEKTTLEAGDSIPIKGAVGKSGKSFDCRVRYGIKENGERGIIPEFENKK